MIYLESEKNLYLYYWESIWKILYVVFSGKNQVSSDFGIVGIL